MGSFFHWAYIWAFPAVLKIRMGYVFYQAFPRCIDSTRQGDLSIGDSEFCVLGGINGPGESTWQRFVAHTVVCFLVGISTHDSSSLHVFFHLFSEF